MESSHSRKNLADANDYSLWYKRILSGKNSCKIDDSLMYRLHILIPHLDDYSFAVSHPQLELSQLTACKTAELVG